jgi:hypothetical protein
MRIVGRPRKRRIAGIEKEMQIKGIRGWRNQCEERSELNSITERAKTNIGL